jgi:hypothetical protein
VVGDETTDMAEDSNKVRINFGDPSFGAASVPADEE